MRWQPQRVRKQQQAATHRQLFAAAVLVLIFVACSILGPSLDGADKVAAKNMIGAAKYKEAREVGR